MDHLILKWTLQHSMKYSMKRLIKEIPQRFPWLQCVPNFEAFITYATSLKISSKSNCLNYDERKILYTALKKFIKAAPDISSHQCVTQYMQLLLFLKWLIEVQKILKSQKSQISHKKVLILKKHNETFEKEWSTFSDKTLPYWCDAFEEIKFILTNENAVSKDTYLESIFNISKHVHPLLEICVKGMQFYLPSSGIEEIQNTTAKNTFLKQDGLLPSNSRERFMCLTTLIKKDASEEGLLSMVNLVLKSPPEDPHKDVKQHMTEMHSLEDVNRFGIELVNQYKSRLFHYKGLLREVHPLLKRKRCGNNEGGNVEIISEKTCSPKRGGDVENHEEMQIESEVCKLAEATVCDDGEINAEEMIHNVLDVKEPLNISHNLGIGIENKKESEILPFDLEEVSIDCEAEKTPADIGGHSEEESQKIPYELEDGIRVDPMTEDSPPYFTCMNEPTDL